MLSRTYCAPFPYICTIRKKYCSLQEHLATLAVSRRWVLRAAASRKMRGIGWRQYYIFNTICRAYLNYSRLHLQTVQVVFNFNSRLCPVGCRQMRATLLGMEYEQDITGLASLVLFILAGCCHKNASYFSFFFFSPLHSDLNYSAVTLDGGHVLEKKHLKWSQINRRP